MRFLAAARSVCEAVCLKVEPAAQVEPEVGVVIAAPPADGTHIEIGVSAAATPQHARPPVMTAASTPLRRPNIARPPQVGCLGRRYSTFRGRLDTWRRSSCRRG